MSVCSCGCFRYINRLCWINSMSAVVTCVAPWYNTSSHGKCIRILATKNSSVAWRNIYDWTTPTDILHFESKLAFGKSFLSHQGQVPNLMMFGLYCGLCFVFGIVRHIVILQIFNLYHHLVFLCVHFRCFQLFLDCRNILVNDQFFFSSKYFMFYFVYMYEFAFFFISLVTTYCLKENLRIGNFDFAATWVTSRYCSSLIGYQIVTAIFATILHSNYYFMLDKYWYTISKRPTTFDNFLKLVIFLRVIDVI